jgi:hypothetical protein
MDGERDARDADWLSLGAETVPLRDSAAQTAERERVERLRLISKRRCLRLHENRGIPAWPPPSKDETGLASRQT